MHLLWDQLAEMAFSREIMHAGSLYAVSDHHFRTAYLVIRSNHFPVPIMEIFSCLM